LPGSHEVLSAAHGFTDAAGNFNATTATVTFTSGPPPIYMPTVAVRAVYLPRAWNGDPHHGSDYAVLELAQSLPAIPGSPLFRGNNEVGLVGTKVGYGRTGTGNTGDTQASAVKHFGLNRYDAPPDLFDDGVAPDFYAQGTPPAGTQLAFDFDNGLA